MDIRLLSRLLTNHQLPDILPVELAALLVNEGDCDPSLDPLQRAHPDLISCPRIYFLICLIQFG